MTTRRTILSAALTAIALAGLFPSAASAQSDRQLKRAERDSAQTIVISDPVNGRRTISSAQIQRSRTAAMTRQAKLAARGRSTNSGRGVAASSGTAAASGGTGGIEPTDGGSAGYGIAAFDQHDSQGWTVFTPSSDSRIIYVSSSEGDDEAARFYDLTDEEARATVGVDPFNPSGEIKAFKTLDQAEKELRNGMPDWLLIKRGDTWDEPLGRVKKGGRDENAPMLISAYGDLSDPRPVILSGSSNGFSVGRPDPFYNIAIVGLHFEAHTRVPGEKPIGMNLASEFAKNILIEDCFISGYKDNIIVQSRGDDPVRNVVIRRCTLVDSWNTDGHSQGIFAKYVHGLTIDECLFDHNGWSEEIPGAHATVFNHNMYLSTTNEDVIVRNCISARAAATGLQARTGGTVHGNVLVDNPHGLQFGQSNGVPFPHDLGSLGDAYDNVIFASLPREGISGNTGMLIGNLGDRSLNKIYSNIIVGEHGSTLGMGVDGTNNYGLHGVSIHENIVYNFDRCLQVRGELGADLTDIQFRSNTLQQHCDVDDEIVQFRDDEPDNDSVSFFANRYFSSRPEHRWFFVRGPGQVDFSTWIETTNEARAVEHRQRFSDPERTVMSYNASLGGEPTLDDFFDNARKNRRGSWEPQYTAQAVGQYVREGFTVIGQEINNSNQGRFQFRRGRNR